MMKTKHLKDQAIHKVILKVPRNNLQEVSKLEETSTVAGV